MRIYRIAQDREYPVAAIVSANDRLFEGNSHAEAVQKAINFGCAYFDDEDILRDKTGKEMTYDGSIDLFRTNKGRIINRFEAYKMNEATSSEKIPEQEIDTLDKIINKYTNNEIDVYATDNGKGIIELHNLNVPRNMRKQGIGTSFMNELCDYADRTKKEIHLNLASRESGETTSKNRLIEFYKRFGFVRNFGRTKDFRISCQMYRRPK
jgi:GNAT superfamily N-acetyltransferase